MSKLLFRKKEIEELLQNEGTIQLKKTLGAFDLLLLGVGAIVGTGIFILPGTVAATHAGPGIVFSFIIAAIVCAFAGMCYSEFASSVPVTGSAYTYGYIVFGEIVAWLVGWALLLEYGLAVAAVATGWSSYLNSLLAGFHIVLPQAISGAFNPAAGTYINVPAIFIIFATAFLLTLGIKESTRFNSWMVFLKVAVILLFIGVGVFYVKPTNWEPFLPFGISGVFSGAALVFFAYLGFDAVSSAAEEVKNPQRNMPIGIIGSLLICTVLYVAVSMVLTGIVPYHALNVSDPVSYVMQLVHQDWIAGIISLGAVVGMMTVILVMSYGGTRLLYALGRDGLLPKSMAELSPKFKTPVKNTWIFALLVAFCAGFVPLSKLAELVNMGTLVAFTIVSIGVVYLRKNKNIPSGGFKVPFFPVLPILSFLLCLFLISQLSILTWIACGIWFIIGLIVYLAYGRKNSEMNKQ
ncbi:amino acid permease [Lysinibacillus sphaericus]|uniref:Amino acid permease n=1 Tax=Lysinibacillus pinottii TaxID=2973932 RepID=A0ABT2DLR8_9BACI|nr:MULTISPECIES: amino acid permease [Lysinibacillus]MBE5083725.1 amino acid permease [Bacillus thuringiensis]MBG9727321.1 amino acid permease [Lysinibacillus fusiformis]AMO34249.1 amino acid permease [Lysinibacillus sphaericus]AMR90638.1 amino acid permease [Lysinibacillus sphaericus]ANA44688.1 amino acid permease [Lysinibacillus sphaericus]